MKYIILFLILLTSSVTVYADNVADINAVASTGIIKDTSEQYDFAKVKDKAEQGDAHAQFVLGMIYLIGQKTSPEQVKIPIDTYGKTVGQNEFFTKSVESSAKNGDEVAKQVLSILNNTKESVPLNNKEAFRLIKLSAEQGDENSQVFFASMYALGLGTPVDNKEAFKWTKLVAEKGDSGAQFRLGIMYLAGQGTPVDAEEYLKWLKLSASNGNKNAQGLLKYISSTEEKASKNNLQHIEQKSIVKP